VTSAPSDDVERTARHAQQRIAESANHHAFAPRDAERIVFEVAGHGDLGLKTSQAARRIADDAKRHAKSSLKQKYGGRAPGQGWIGWLLVLAAICAALSAAMSSGFRADPEDRELAAVALAVAAALINLVTLVGARLQPLDRVLWRIQAVVVVALALAAGLTLARGAVAAGIVMTASAAVVLGMLVAMLTARAMRPDAAADIDGSTARAYLEAIDAAEAAATALQTQVDEELGQERARFVRSVRTTAFAGAPAVNRARVDLARYGDSVPAGGVIIDGFADPANWLPRDVAAKAEASG
jgi:hypothetical protein